MGKGWTEKWQGLGCREGGGKVGCAKACGQTFELARAGLRGLRCGGDDSQKVSEDYVLGAWMCPGPFPRCPQSPETGRDLAGICLWRAGKQGSVAFSWGPGLAHEAAEGSSGMPFLLLAPALTPLPAGT